MEAFKPEENYKRKVLLMGKSGSGKTSMRSIIFANYIVDVEHSHVKFLENLVLNIWDCGAQDLFMENCFLHQRGHIFRNVQVLIFVFDVDSRENEKDLNYYKKCLEALKQNSPNSKIFCLIHKMDLVPKSSQNIAFKSKEIQIKLISHPYEITCCKTSIWDETLYKAWSAIVYSLIPNVKIVEQRLEKLRRICEADEVVLFEKVTFLVISHTIYNEFQHEPKRLERICNLIKQFKLSCSKSQAQFTSMQVRNSNFSAWIQEFTKDNTYIMIITTDKKVQPGSTLLNINLARRYFESQIKVFTN